MSQASPLSYEFRFQHGPQRQSRVEVLAVGDGAALMQAMGCEAGVTVEVWQADRFIARITAAGDKPGRLLH